MIAVASRTRVSSEAFSSSAVCSARPYWCTSQTPRQRKPSGIAMFGSTRHAVGSRCCCAASSMPTMTPMPPSTPSIGQKSRGRSRRVVCR
jgi:hypothetical protein